MSDIMGVVRMSLLSDSPQSVTYVWVEGTPDRVKVYWHNGSWRFAIWAPSILPSSLEFWGWAEGSRPSDQAEEISRRFRAQFDILENWIVSLGVLDQFKSCMNSWWCQSPKAHGLSIEDYFLSPLGAEELPKLALTFLESSICAIAILKKVKRRGGWERKGMISRLE